MASHHLHPKFADGGIGSFNFVHSTHQPYTKGSLFKRKYSREEIVPVITNSVRSFEIATSRDLLTMVRLDQARVFCVSLTLIRRAACFFDC